MALTSYQILTAIRDACAAIPGLASCRLGIETPIVPDAYPMIRVVLSVSRERTEGNPWAPLLEIIVYYGEYVRPFKTDDIGDQHEWLLAMEDQIKTAIIPGHGWRARWVETVWDEDRIPGLKLLASRFEVQ